VERAGLGNVFILIRMDLEVNTYFTLGEDSSLRTILWIDSYYTWRKGWRGRKEMVLV
jgi:hypothetical protein